jgi:hypothetical protein
MERELPHNQDNGDIEPTREEVDRYLGHLEKDALFSPAGHGESPVQAERQELDSRAYYEKARAKVESFLPALDPNLMVSIATVNVAPNRADAHGYRTLALRFSHKNKPHIVWTMEIEKDDNYIDTQLEGIVKTIYERKAKSM